MSTVILSAYVIYMITDCNYVTMVDRNSVFQNTRCFYLDYICEFNVYGDYNISYAPEMLLMLPCSVAAAAQLHG
jgi:hypothetical protein